MSYLTYDEYLEYGGTLDETTYNDFEFEAESIINYYTFNRLVNDKTIQEPVKRLVKALVDLAMKKNASLSLGKTASGEGVEPYITQQSNDGVTTSYNGMSAYNLYQLSKSEIQRLVYMYLGTVVNELGQKVLYRGFYKGE